VFPLHGGKLEEKLFEEELTTVVKSPDSGLYQCPRSGCKFTSTRKLCLSGHLRTHRSCEICGDSFSGRRSLATFKRHGY
jgi:hypothetical protein